MLDLMAPATGRTLDLGSFGRPMSSAYAISCRGGVFEILGVGARLPRPLTGLPGFNPTMERRLPMAGEASQRDGRRVPVTWRDVDSGRVSAQRALGRLWR